MKIAIDDVWNDPDRATTYGLLSEIYAARGDRENAGKFAAKADAEFADSYELLNCKTGRIDHYPSSGYWKRELDGTAYLIKRPGDFKVGSSATEHAPDFLPVS